MSEDFKKLQTKYGANLRPYILGDFNDCRRIEQTIDELCHEFKLVDIYSYLHPNEPDFKTYRRGQKRIDRGLIPEFIAKKMKQHAESQSGAPTVYYEAFFHRFCGDHRALVIDIPRTVMFRTGTESPFDVKGIVRI